MTDILDELAKIKVSERNAEKIIFEAKQRSEKLIQSSKEGLRDLTKSADEEILVNKKETEKNYKKTTELMLEKLRKDYDLQLNAIKNLPVQQIAAADIDKIIDLLKEYGNTVYKEIK